MLPVKPDKTSARKNALARALERFRARGETAAAVPLYVEQQPRTVPNEVFHVTRCAVTGRYFKVLYRRSPEDGKFVPVTQIKMGQPDAYARSAGGSGGTGMMIASEEFRHSSP